MDYADITSTEKMKEIKLRTEVVDLFLSGQREARLSPLLYER
jgi:hypothetical protein